MDKTIDRSSAKEEVIMIKKIRIDRSETIPVASFSCLGTPQDGVFARAKADLFDIKPEFLNFEEKKNMKQIVGMEVPLGQFDAKGKEKIFRYEGSTPKTKCQTDTFVAVLDTQTGEAVMYPAEVFTMMPCVKGFGKHPWRMRMDIDDPDRKSDDIDVNDKQRKERQNYELTTTFGSSKKSRLAKAKMRNKVDNQMVEQEIKHYIDEADLSQREAEKPTVPGDDSNLLPPINLEAKLSSEVYNLEDLMPVYLQEEILTTGEAQAMVQGDEEKFKTWKENGTMGRHVMAQINTMSKDPDRRRFQAKNLFFIHTLVTLHNMGCQDIRKKNVMVQDGWHKRLTNFFLKRYTKETLRGDGSKQRCMPTILKDKALLHIIIVSLIHQDYSVIANDLVSDLKAKGIDEKVRALCTLARAHHYKKSGKLWIDLDTPLPKYKEEDKSQGSRKRKI